MLNETFSVIFEQRAFLDIIQRIFFHFLAKKKVAGTGVTFLILKHRLFLTAPFEIKRRKKRYVLLLPYQTSFVRNAINANYPRTVKLASENYNFGGKIRHLNFLHQIHFLLVFDRD